jgi:hypothetical protein
VTDTAVYLYAVAAEQPELTGVDGVSETPVRTVTHAGLVAVVGTVPLTEYGEQALRDNFEDLRWLEAAARAHHAVVAEVAHRTATAPVRLATVFRDDSRVTELLDQRRTELEAALALVSGRSEWGVKVYADAPVSSASVEPEADGPNPGTTYLLRRRSQRDSREDAARRTAAQAQEIHRELASHAAAERRHPPQDPKLSGHTGEMVLNAAYLVDDRRASAFVQAAEVRRAPGVTIETTGPWPAYSFVSLESSA